MSYKPRDAAITSRIMATIPQKNSKAEVALRRELHRRGLRYRVHRRGLPGTPDIVFPREMVAIFVDGDFWHGRRLREADGEVWFEKKFRQRPEYWRQKLERNIARDARDTATLRASGWLVMRLWEGDILRDMNKAATDVQTVVLERRRNLRRSERTIHRS